MTIRMIIKTKINLKENDNKQNIIPVITSTIPTISPFPYSPTNFLVSQEIPPKI